MARTKEQLQDDLKHPPKGVPREQWEEAKKANRDPEKFVPVIVFGFEGIKNRVDMQVCGPWPVVPAPRAKRPRARSAPRRDGRALTPSLAFRQNYMEKTYEMRVRGDMDKVRGGGGQWAACGAAVRACQVAFRFDAHAACPFRLSPEH